MVIMSMEPRERKTRLLGVYEKLAAAETRFFGAQAYNLLSGRGRLLACLTAAASKLGGGRSEQAPDGVLKNPSRFPIT